MSPASGDAIRLEISSRRCSTTTGGAFGVQLTFTDITRSQQLQRNCSDTGTGNPYEELQSTNEELETTNEELQSTVEELETTNEELQSTNEELETMNEELQLHQRGAASNQRGAARAVARRSPSGGATRTPSCAA